MRAFRQAISEDRFSFFKILYRKRVFSDLVYPLGILVEDRLVFVVGKSERQKAVYLGFYLPHGIIGPEKNAVGTEKTDVMPNLLITHGKKT